MKRFLLLFVIIILGTSALAAKYYVDDQTHEFYKRELLNRGWLYGCIPPNWSLTEPGRGGLGYAVMKNRVDIVELELKAGLDPNDCNMGSSNISEYTMIKKNAVILDLLLKYGLDINKKSGMYTLLTMAIRYNSPECVKTLIKYNIDVNEEYKNKYPLNYSIKKNNAEVVKLLLDAGALPNDKTYKLIKRSNNQKIKQLFYEKFPQR